MWRCGKTWRGAQKIACVWERFDQITGCPIRTCLWSCVGRRGSGQEASQPPSKDRQPEANRRTPPNGGRDLKQRRTGLFWSPSALQTMALIPVDGASLRLVMATAHHLALAAPSDGSLLSHGFVSGRGGGST